MHKKVHILLPLACDLNLVITSEASRVVNSCSFTGIFLFPYFNSTKGVKKTMASGNSRTRSSISPIRLDCSIRVYLNFALRKQEKLNNLLPQFFCVYTNRHLINTYLYNAETFSLTADSSENQICLQATRSCRSKYESNVHFKFWLR